MKKALFVGVAVGIAFQYVASQVVATTWRSLDFETVSQKDSPSGAYTVQAIRSNGEGGHAPYGQHLLLRSNSGVQFPDAKDGHVIFAGYCEQPVDYAWVGDKRITIVCKARDKGSAATRVTVSRGVSIEVMHSGGSD